MVENTEIKFLSWNIHNHHHNFLEYRSDHLGQLLNLYNPDILCFQEYGKDIDIKSDFRKKYLSDYNFSRTKQMLGVAIKKEKYRFIKTYVSGNLPVNVSLVEDVRNNDLFIVANVHLDYRKIYRDDSVRLSQIQSILKLIAQCNNDYPIVLAGDFNCLPNSSPLSEAKKYFTDTYVPQENVIGTWYNYGTIKNLSKRIDYILVNKKVNPVSYEIIDKKIDGQYPSDHLPIVTVLNLK
jgi:endonuclease/exonuclease/phosphatase family metal-dependent hydrolase